MESYWPLDALVKDSGTSHAAKFLDLSFHQNFCNQMFYQLAKLKLWNLTLWNSMLRYKYLEKDFEARNIYFITFKVLYFQKSGKIENIRVNFILSLSNIFILLNHCQGSLLKSHVLVEEVLIKNTAVKTLLTELEFSEKKDLLVLKIKQLMT